MTPSTVVRVVDRLRGRRCSNPIRHQPRYLRVVRHHVHPQMWGGGDEPSNLVDLCDTCHYGAHVLIDGAVRLGRWFTRAELEGVPMYVAGVAKRGFLARPFGPVLPTLA